MTHDEETKELFGKLYATAALYGFSLLKYDSNGFEVLEPAQYDDLIAAINWQKDNMVKL